jgi:hypothetical protein
LDGEESVAMSLTFPVDAKLKDRSLVQLVLTDNQDIEPLRSLYRVIVEEGTLYPHDWGGETVSGIVFNSESTKRQTR